MLIYKLHFQGFRNPSIFVLTYTHIPETGFAGQLSQVSLGWNYLKTSFPSSYIALLGDSTGATLGLGLLLHIANPACHVTSAVAAKPDAAIFLSPVCSYIGQVGGSITGIGNDGAANGGSGSIYPKQLPDYMEPWMYKKYGELLTTATRTNAKGGLIPEGVLDVYMNPGLCKSRDWWAKAMPRYGVLLMYGDEEYLRAEIEELYMMMTRAGECRIAGAKGQLHNWVLFQLMVAATVEDREQGVENIAISLSHMILWRNLTSVEREDKFEQYLIRKLG